MSEAAGGPQVAFVVFDMDEVLYDFNQPVRLAALEKLSGRPQAEIQQAIWGSGFEEKAEAGDPATGEAYLKGFADCLGYAIDRQTWAAIRKGMMRPRPQVLSLAEAVSEEVDAALLTNNGMLLKECLSICAPEVVTIFGEQAHVSAEFGARKPDPEVFRRICAQYGHAPEETLFVDDNPEFIAGAQEAGLKTHLYENPVALRKTLVAFGFDL